MKRSKAQLRAISKSYTQRNNQEAYNRMLKWFNSNDIICTIFNHDLDFYIKQCKLKYDLKSNSYVVLEKALMKREAIY